MQNLPYWRLSGFYFFYFAFVGAMAPFWGLYLKSLEFNAFQIGVLMSLLQVMRIFAPNIWSWIADRHGKRVLIVQIAAMASMASYIGVFFGTSFLWLFIVMSLMSFFWSASLPLVEATTLSHLGKKTDQYGKIRLWGSIGFILAVVGLGYLLDFMPIRFLLWAILGMMAGLVLFSRYIPEAQMIAHETDHLSVWHIIKKPEVFILIAACFLMAAAHGPYYTFYSIYLVDNGYSKSSVGWLWALGVICEIAVFIWMPKLFRIFTLQQILLFSFAMAVLRFLLIAWGVKWLGVILFAQILHAASFGSYHASAVALIHHHFKGKHQSKGQGIYNSVAFGAGGTLGGLYSGYSWDSLGPNVTFTIASGFAFLAMVLLIWKVGLNDKQVA
ncbi:MFS transporter [Sulfurirhabdus autotrophica]|nr:MFS transporter [Sulfurirhabdus autotrophica]